MATPIRIGSVGGEYMETVTVVEWLAAPGERVSAGDVVVVVETAKAATDVEAPCDGVLSRRFAEVGDEVEVSASLGLVGVDAADVAVDGETPAVAATQAVETDVAGVAPAPADRGGRTVASPFARRLARELGVDLGNVSASSPSGRIKARDVRAVAGADRRASTAGGALNVVRAGSGTTRLVLLHGFGADASAWRDLLPRLGHAVTSAAIELPAHGRSPREPVAGFEQLVAQVLDAFDAEGEAPVHLVGHSLGGAVAVRLAALRPARVRSLLLVAPAGLGPEIDGEFVAGLLRATRPQSLAPWLRRMVHDPVLIPDEFVGGAMLLRADPRLREAQARLADAVFPDGTQGFDVGAALHALPVPVRIVWGREDRIIPWRHALRAPGRVGLHLLAGVGHLPHFEAPAEVAHVLGDLVRTASG